MRFFRPLLKNQQGYVLPATIALGLAVATVSITLLQSTSISSQNLNNATYKAIAQEAANAGLTSVESCVQNNQISWTTLTPHTGCSGLPLTGSNSTVAQQGSDWQSTYSVGAPKIANGLLTALSTGTVRLYSGTTVVATYTAQAKITLPSIPTTEPVATGNMITDIKNEGSDCAIANGKLYCWGDNTYGQLGRGYTGNTPPVGNPSLGTPVDVGSISGSALAGKTVTNISVAKGSVCAIADGTPYCWGNNSDSQLGYSGGDINIPTSNIPVTASGPLSGHITVEISTASGNLPTAYWWLAITGQHTCARTEDGSVSCWGFGAYGQLSGGGCIGFFWSICGFPSYSTPTLVDGYANTTGPFDGMKADRVGASSHDSCLVAQGKMYCWGVIVPLYIGCNSVDFHPYPSPGIPGAGCAQLGMGMYNMSTASGSSISSLFVDPAAWELSTNESCMMASSNFYCTGITPAFTNPFVSWFDAWKAPWQVVGTTNVTSSDNGADPDSPGLNGLYCTVASGAGSCSGSFSNPYTGTNIAGDLTLHPLVGTSSVTGGIGIGSKMGTKIAAGTNHGCIVANGQLLCWGDGSTGKLADSNTTAHTVTTPTATGSSAIGITDGTYAAHNSISVGKDFACGIVNAQVFCWGDNSYGKLGLDTATLVPSPNNKQHPQRLPDIANYYATKVSAGTNHACAIVSGQAGSPTQLWCWGDNTYGQLGIGTNNNQSPSPQQVGHNATNTGLFDTKRITDVSAGDKNTCVIADGQLYCWGDNSHRQLGNADLLHAEKDSPILVNNNGFGRQLTTSLDVTAVTVGMDHVCAIANADAYCWGNNASYKTGINTNLLDSDPTLLTMGTAGTTPSQGGKAGPNGVRPYVSAISAGSDYTCAIINAQVSCWGNNANGRTGQGSSGGATTPYPQQIKGAAQNYYATAISAGYDHTCAILDGTSTGNLFCWGSRGFNAITAPSGNGQLGVSDPGPTSDISTVDVSGTSASIVNGKDNSGKSVTNIAAGYDSTCDIANGDIQCWGTGSSGQIGNDSTGNQNLPTITSIYSIGVFTKPMIY